MFEEKLKQFRFSIHLGILLLILVNLSSCSWVNAAGRANQGLGDGLQKASEETEPGFTKSLFGVTGKIHSAIGNILVEASGNHSKNNSPSLDDGDRKKVVREVQSKLNQLGYNAGAEDGQMGSNTAGAIRKYQQDNSLSVSGNINKELIQSLNL